MATENNLYLVKYYKEQSDEQIKELLKLGQDGFEPEAYEIIRNEARLRGIYKIEPDTKVIEKPLGEMTRAVLMIATMEPFEDRGYGTTSGSGFWSHSMIGVMAPLHDRHYGTTPGSGLWRHKYPFSKQ